MNVACDYEAPMQMLTTEKYITAHTTIVQTHINPSDFYRQVKRDS